MLVLFWFFLYYLCYKRIQQTQAKMSPAWPIQVLTAWGGADNTAQQGRAASAYRKHQAPPPRTEPIQLLRQVQTLTDFLRRRLWNALCPEHPHSLCLSVLTTESFTTPYMTRSLSPCFSGKSPVLLFFLSYNPNEKMRIPFRSLTVAIRWPVGFPVHLLGPVHQMIFL